MTAFVGVSLVPTQTVAFGVIVAESAAGIFTTEFWSAKVGSGLEIKGSGMMVGNRGRRYGCWGRKSCSGCGGKWGVCVVVWSKNVYNGRWGKFVATMTRIT